MKQKIFWLAVLLGTSPGIAEQTNELSLDGVIAEVLANNLSLKAANANWRAMQARARREGAWADPRVGVDVERMGSTDFGDYNATEWMVGQEIPLSGKNRRRAKAATAEAEGALAAADRRGLDLTRDATAAFYNLVNAQAQLEINDRNTALLRQLAETSRINYEAGTRMQSDVFMADAEVLKNTEARRDLEQRLAEAGYRLNVLMNRPPTNALGRAVLPAVPSPDYDANDLEKQALLHRPELREAAQRIAATKARQDVAKRAWIPDPELRVEARQFEGGGARIREYDTGIFFNFPWINRGKYKAAIDEAKRNRESAEYQLQALENETRGLVREHIKRIETLHHHYTLFRDRVTPLARQAIESMRISYTNDKATFLELLTAQRALQDVESMTQQHLTDYLIATAEFKAMKGGPK